MRIGLVFCISSGGGGGAYGEKLIYASLSQPFCHIWAWMRQNYVFGFKKIEFIMVVDGFLFQRFSVWKHAALA